MNSGPIEEWRQNSSHKLPHHNTEVNCELSASILKHTRTCRHSWMDKSAQMSHELQPCISLHWLHGNLWCLRLYLYIFQTLIVKHECRCALGLVFKVHSGRRGCRNVCNNVTAKLQHTIYVTERAALSRLPAAIKGSGALLVPQRSAERCSRLYRHQFQRASLFIMHPFFYAGAYGKTHTHMHAHICHQGWYML